MTDPLDIVNEFSRWSPETTGKPCPIDVRDENRAWLRRLCGLAERCANAENLIDKLLKTEKFEVYEMSKCAPERQVIEWVDIDPEHPSYPFEEGEVSLFDFGDGEVTTGTMFMESDGDEWDSTSYEQLYCWDFSTNKFEPCEPPKRVAKIRSIENE